MNKTISIFLASSNELKIDRIEFGDFVRSLDNIYEKRGTRVELLKWEEFDAAYNDRRKQDEYNEIIRTCNIFLALFHTKAGHYTIEEFEVAYKEFQLKKLPKIYIFCKDLQPGEFELPELTDFKNRLKYEMGHYWCQYNNCDRLQLQFTLQLLKFEDDNMGALKVEENGKITLESIPIANIYQMPFVTKNKDFQNKLAELETLPKKIEEAYRLKEQIPDNQYVIDEYQTKVNYFEQLKKDCHQYLVSILETAKRIAEMQNKRDNDIMQQAFDAFENGDIELTNSLLDIALRDAEKHVNNLKKERWLVHQNIKALRLKASTVMAEIGKSISDRIERISKIYENADNWAQYSAYDTIEHIALLLDYAEFIYQYIPRHHSKALLICNRIINYYNSIEKDEDLQKVNIASCYNLMGKIHSEMDELVLAQEYYETAYEIAQKTNGYNQSEIARYIANIGGSYYDLGLNDEALHHYLDAAKIFEQLINEGAEVHIMLASIYDNIGQVYADNDDYQEALEYYNNALAAYKEYDGIASHVRIAHVYQNIGAVYQERSCYDQALKAYQKALEHREKELGIYHPETAISYFSIGMLNYEQNQYNEALTFLNKALDIQDQVLGKEHFDTERTCKYIQLAREGLESY